MVEDTGPRAGHGNCDGTDIVGPAHPDLHKCCSFVGQTELDRRKTNHTCWMSVRNLRGTRGQRADGLRLTTVGRAML